MDYPQQHQLAGAGVEVSASQETFELNMDELRVDQSAYISEDMKPAEGLVEDPEGNGTLAGETKPPRVPTRVQGCGNNENLYFSKATYLSILKGNVSVWDNENDIFQQKSPLGNTVLHIAAGYGHDDLVEKTAKLWSAKNDNGDTALHVAAKAGRISTLKRLLAHLDAHINNLRRLFFENLKEALDEVLVKNKQGNTFFHEALLCSDKDVIDFLLSNEPQFEDGNGIKKLVERAALLWANNEEKSVLYLAIEAGYKDVVDRVLSKLINQDPALDQLIENHSHHELAELLPQYGSGYVPAGKSPLLAAIFNQDQDILHILLTRKPEWIHLRDSEDRIPLHYAASIGYLEGVQYLLKKCPTCANDRDKSGFSPLHLASNGGYVKVVEELLKHCPYFREILDQNGRNILHIAAEGGKFNMVRYILRAADHELVKEMLNDKDAHGNTPLHLATLRCHPKIVHDLTWDKRVNFTLFNEDNQTALDLCGHNSSSRRKILTWIALKSARVPSYADTSRSIKVPPDSTRSLWEKKDPKMDAFKDRINTLMLVSTLIITATFAAAFTLPGGDKSSDIVNRMWYKLFIFCTTISMYGSVSVTIILIWAQLEDVYLARRAIEVAMPLLGVTLTTLSVAFLAGVHLIISNLSWLATTILVMCVIFTLVILLLYILLWVPSSSSILVVRYISYYPFLLAAWLVERDEAGGTKP